MVLVPKKTDKLNMSAAFALPECVQQIISAKPMKLIRELGAGSQSFVYLINYKNQMMTLKVPRTYQNLDETWKNYQREASILARIENPYLAKVYEVNRVGDIPYMLTEFINGHPLSEVIQNGKLAEEKVWQLARCLAEALACVHQRKFIHRDLNPKNILISDQRTVLIDFSLAISYQSQNKHDDFAGTLAYSSPEQLAVSKTVIDGRSDLYSLGCTLYECLIGKPPFEANKTADLLRSHAVEVPEPVHAQQSGISLELSQIISKLLEKDPERRFQSAEHLLLAIDKKTNPRISPAEETPFCGRAEELTQLIVWKKELSQLKHKILLIEGDSGSGKSRLAREFLNATEDSQHRVLRTHCSRENLQPFVLLRQLLDQTLLDFSAEEIRVAAGPDGHHLARFSSQLKVLFPNAAESEIEMDNLPYIVQDFLKALYQKRNILLFVDDLQWIDENSRRFLNALLADLKFPNLLIVATVQREESFKETVAALLRASTMRKISLQPLGLEEVHNLCEKILNGNVSSEFTERIFRQSEGSPYAICEFMTTMLDEGLLNPSWGQWLVDLEGIERLQMPTDILDLFLKRLDRLSNTTRPVLLMAAVYGRQFATEPLAELCNLEIAEVTKSLEEAHEARLIEREGHNIWHFAHDHIRNALLENLDTQSKSALHQKIAEVLDHSGHSIHSVAYHYMNGIPSQEPQRTVLAVINAARASVRSFADHQAYEYFQFVDQISKEFLLSADIAFLESFAQVALRLGKSQEALSAFERALALTEDSVHRARLQIGISKVHQADCNFDQAYQYYLKALAEVHHSSPTGAFSLVMTLMYVVRFLFISVTGIGFGTKHTKSRNYHQAMVELWTQGSTISLFQLRGLELPQVSLRLLYHAYRLGPSRELCNALSKVNLVFKISHFDFAARKMVRTALKFAEELKDPQALANAKLYSAMSNMLTQTDLTATQELQQCIETNSRWLSIEELINGTGALLWRYQVAGLTREVLELTQTYRPIVENAKTSLVWFQVAGWCAHAFHGENKEALKLKDEFRSAPAPGLYPLLDSWGYELCYLAEIGDLGPHGDEIIRSLQERSPNPLLAPPFLKQSYVYVARFRLLQYRQSSANERAIKWLDFKKSMSTLPFICDLPVLRAHFLFLKAAQAREEGNIPKAFRIFAKAHRLSLRYHLPWLLQEIALERAEMHLLLGEKAAAKHFALESGALAQSQGWTERTRRVQKAFQSTSLTSTSFGSHLSSAAQKGSVSQIRRQQYLDALFKVSLSSTSVFEVEKFGAIVLDEISKVLGAERGFLFIEDPQRELMQLVAARDSQGKDVMDLTSYSRQIVEKVRTEKSSLVLSANSIGEVDHFASVQIKNLRSIIAAPLVLRNKVMGVIYLDSRLSAGMFSEDDLEILLALANHVAISIETSRATQLELEKRGMEKDLELSAAVQQFILPRTSTVDHREFQLHAKYRPATQCGGDWWWYKAEEDGRLFLFLGDVTGHGTPSAMITAIVAATFKLLENSSLQVPEILATAHRQLKDFAKENYLMTMMAIEYDPATRILRSWNAGAPNFVVLRASGECKYLGNPGTPLGVNQDSLELGYEEYQLIPQDRLILFTDGLPEAENKEGKLFGDRNLRKAFVATQGLTPEKALETIYQSIDSFTLGELQKDDYTCAIVNVK